MSCVPAFATEEEELDIATISAPVQTYKYVVDSADVLTDEEENALNNKLTEVYETYGYDLVILTTMGVDPDERMATADDYYDYNDYCGNGALLLSNFQEDGTYVSGNSWISTSGSCISNITDDDIQNIGYDITYYLESGEYKSAFTAFIQETVATVEDNQSAEKSNKYMIIVVCMLVVGIVGAFIYTGRLKRQLISVAEARDANNYLVDGSMNITNSRDTYLYSNVVRREKPKESKSGSSTHTSSSGSSHGGGGF